MAASATMMRLYLRPLALSGLSSDQNSNTPPARFSMRWSCVLRRVVTGAKVRRASRHTSNSIL